MELRNPNKSHYPEIVALLQRCFQPAWSAQGVADRIYYDPDYDPNHVWMAREQGRMLGFMVCTLHGEQAYLKLLAVDPSARRHGLGRDLLSRAEYRLSWEGAKRLVLESTPPHEFVPGIPEGGEAEAFFRAQGYTATHLVTTWVPPLGGEWRPADAAPFDKASAAAFARSVAGAVWPWVEDTLGYAPPRMAFRPGRGLVLADPGQSLGPLWLDPAAPPGALEELIQAGLAIASSLPCDEPKGLRFWHVPGSEAWPMGLRAEQHSYLSLSKTLL